MSDKKIIDCPFCGSENVKVILLGGFFKCSCEMCDSSSCLCATENIAIQAWNGRINPLDRPRGFNVDHLYEVDATHTDPTQQATALALAVKQLARVEAALAEMSDVLGSTLLREKAYLELIRRHCCDSGDRDGCQIQSPNYDCAKLCVLGMLSAGNETPGVTKANKTLRQYRDRQLEDVLMPDKGGAE